MQWHMQSTTMIRLCVCAALHTKLDLSYILYYGISPNANGIISYRIEIDSLHTHSLTHWIRILFSLHSSMYLRCYWTVWFNVWVCAAFVCVCVYLCAIVLYCALHVQIISLQKQNNWGHTDPHSMFPFAKPLQLTQLIPLQQHSSMASTGAKS